MCFAIWAAKIRAGNLPTKLFSNVYYFIRQKEQELKRTVTNVALADWK
jgi:hypothetical protein